MTMTSRPRRSTAAGRCAASALVVAIVLVAPPAFGHSASDAYLTLDDGAPGAGGTTIVKGRLDVALRDLDFVLALDANGDGDITWRELRPRQPAIDRYVYAALGAAAGGKSCAVRPTSQRVSRRADGAYAALAFDIVCAGAPASIRLDYRLFFAVDPSHRCILVIHGSRGTSSALLSPANSAVELEL